MVTEESPVRDLQQIVDTVRRRWWLLVFTAATAVLTAWWMGRDEVRLYTAESLLLYEESAPVVGFQLGGGNEGIGSQLEIIQSRSVLAPVVDSVGYQLRMLDLEGDRTALITNLEIDPGAQGGAYLLSPEGDGFVLTDVVLEEELGRFRSGERISGPGFSFGPLAVEDVPEEFQFSVARRQAAITSLQARMLVEEGQGPNMMRVMYTDPDPVYAAAVVNQVAGSYQEYSLTTNKSVSGRRRAAIADEMVLLSDSLNAAQQASLEYQRNTQLLNPEVEGNALMTNVLATETELQEQRFEESLLASMVTGLQEGNTTDEGLHRIMALGADLVPGGMELESELRALQAERRRLTSSQFGMTENNPEVVVQDSLIAAIRAQMRVAAEQSLELHRARIRSTEDRLARVRGDIRALPERTAEYTRLQQRVEAIQAQFDILVAQYFQAQVEEGAEVGDVQVVDPAPVPMWPDPSRRALKMALALVAGLVVGGLGAVTLDQLDSRVRGTRDAERAVHLQVLGTVPKINSGSANPKSVLIGKEAFRGLRTNIRFALSEQPRLMAITSSAPAEGKSTIAVNLALTLAEQGSRVLLIDADLRRPQIHRILGVERLPGLADVLMGQAELGHAIVESPVHPGLSVLPGGSATGSPAELVGGDAFMNLVLALREEYDTVLVDTSPVLAVTDAALVGTVADGTIVVVRANQTDQNALSQCVEQLRRVNANLVGIVLNDVPLDNVGYSSYYDSYYDGEGGDRQARHLLQSGGQVS